MVIYVSDAGVTTNRTSYPFANTSPVEKTPRVGSATTSDSVTRQTEKNYVAENTPAYNISISSAGKAAVKTLESLKTGLASINERKQASGVITSDNKAKTAGKKNADETDSFLSSISSDAIKKYSAFISEKDRNTAAADTDKDSAERTDSRTDIRADESDTEKDTERTAAKTEDASEGVMKKQSLTDSDSISTSSLAKYSEYQLQNLVNDGTITESEMNNELAKRGSGESSTAADNGAMASPVNSTEIPSIVREATAAYNFQMSYQINAAILQ